LSKGRADAQRYGQHDSKPELVSHTQSPEGGLVAPNLLLGFMEMFTIGPGPLLY
jgi:hypothetical protein